VRCYLSSFRMGYCTDELVRLAGIGARCAVIANACDAYADADRAEGVARECVALEELGLRPVELDLRTIAPDEAVAALGACDLVWVRGGNSFVLREVLRRSGADQAIRRLLADDAVAYGGYSAGVCVLAPSLEGLELVDDPSAAAEPGGRIRWDGLGVLPYAVVPHYRSPGHPETRACDRLAAHYERRGIAHRTLSDGQVLVIDGAGERRCTPP
jgi:dipeptidase E